MRKRILIIFVIILFILSAGLLILGPFKFSTGIYIAAESPIIVFDNGSGEPVVMLNQTGKENAFARLQTGDKILVAHNGTMMLSYPAQMNIYFCIHLKKGDASAIPDSIKESLEEMGWLEGGTFGQNQ